MALWRKSEEAKLYKEIRFLGSEVFGIWKSTKLIGPGRCSGGNRNVPSQWPEQPSSWSSVCSAPGPSQCSEFSLTGTKQPMDRQAWKEIRDSHALNVTSQGGFPVAENMSMNSRLPSRLSFSIPGLVILYETNSHMSSAEGNFPGDGSQLDKLPTKTTGILLGMRGFPSSICLPQCSPHSGKAHPRDCFSSCSEKRNLTVGKNSHNSWVGFSQAMHSITSLNMYSAL